MPARVALDPERPLREQPERGHNRWHPDLAPVATVDPGDELTLELRDSLDGQLTRDSTGEDACAAIALSHVLTGPVAVNGAEPGDLLEVELLAYETAGFGWTAVIPGRGPLGDLVDEPFLARWDLQDGVARSRDVPGVAIPAAPFAGVVGVAPSPERFAAAREREAALARAGANVRLPDAATAFPPTVADGLRTTPPRENGGNLDVRDLTAGATLLLPVGVAGAGLSAGDLHFAQGDGEVCGYAIETSGAVTLRASVRRAPRWLPRFPCYVAPARSQRRSLATTGLGIGADLDLGLAARQALVAMLDHLGAERGLTREQALVLLSVAVDLRVSETVNHPNPVVSALLPLDIFDT